MSETNLGSAAMASDNPEPCAELPPNVVSSEDELMPPDVESDTDPDMPTMDFASDDEGDLPPGIDTDSDDSEDEGDLPPDTDMPCRCVKKCYRQFPKEYLLKLRSEIQDLPFADRQRKQFDKVRLHLVDNHGKRHNKGKKVHKNNYYGK